MNFQKNRTLNDNEAEWLKKLEPAVDKSWNELNKYEQSFIEGILERFRRYGMQTYLSPKQWDVITGISEKVL